jgi:hypothetical protein
MGALREILAKFGFDVDEKNLDKAKAKTDAYADTLKEVAGVLLGERLIQGIKGFVTELQDQGDALNDSADRLNVNAMELQRWQLAAKFAGAGAEDLNTGLKFLQKAIGEASGGAGDASSAFKKLGVDIKGTDGKLKPANEVLKDTLVGLSKIPEPAERSAAAMKLLGRGGGALLPLIKDGAEGLDGLLGKMEELGGGLSQDALDVIGEAGDRFDEMDFAITSLKSRLAVMLFPALNQMIGWFTKATVGFGKAAEGTHIFQAALIVLGTIAAKVAIGMYAKYLPMIALLAVAILLVDDLITFFEGGDSAAGRLLEKLFGEQAGKSIADRMRQDMGDLVKEVSKADSLGGKIEAVFGTIGGSIVKFFVDDIPEFVRRVFADLTGQTTNFGKGWEGIFDDIFNSILQAAGDWVFDLVKGITEGMIRGLRDKWTDVSDTFKELAKGLIKDFKDVFKIKSPSRVLEDLTAMLPQGAIKALVTWAPKVRAQAQDTFGTMAPVQDTFAPMVRVQTVNAAGAGAAGPRTAHVQSQVSVRVEGSGASAYRDAIREGIGLGMSDQNRELLASLEPSLEA